MNSIHEHASDTVVGLGAAIAEMVRSQGSDAFSDGEVLATMRALAEVGRIAEAGLIELAGQVHARADGMRPAGERLHVQQGCASVTELIERVTRVSSTTARDYVKSAAVLRRDRPVSGGDVVPGRFPQLGDALADGELGVDGFLAATRPLTETGDRLRPDELQAADRFLAARARGVDPETGEPGIPAPSANALRDEARVWAMYFDQDGAEPRDKAAMRKRGITLGRAQHGLVPIRGNLMLESAALLQTVFDAQLNPKIAGPTFSTAGTESATDLCADPDRHDSCAADAACVAQPADGRTPAQRRHDALDAALKAAVGSGDLPTIAGYAPTLTVTVTAAELAEGRGWARADGVDEPVSVDVARHVGCTGRIRQVVFDGNGSIVELATIDRVFNAHQRRAILSRDGGCIIPGCDIPGAWCEIHHVVEWADGGPTMVDNGVALCWHHHRTLGVNGWEIEMRAGVPYVRGSVWWDPKRTWRRAGRPHGRHRDLATSTARSAAANPRTATDQETGVATPTAATARSNDTSADTSRRSAATTRTEPPPWTAPRDPSRSAWNDWPLPPSTTRANTRSSAAARRRRDVSTCDAVRDARTLPPDHAHAPDSG